MPCDKSKNNHKNIPFITPVTNHFEVRKKIQKLGASSLSHVQVSDVNHRGKAQQPIQKGKLRISTEDEANGAKNLEKFTDGAWIFPNGLAFSKMPRACREVTMFYTMFFITYFFRKFFFGGSALSMRFQVTFDYDTPP